MKLSGNTNWGAVTGVLAIVAIAVFALAVPKPKVDPKLDRPIAELEAERERLHERNDATKASVEAMTWQVKRDEVTPQAMAWVSKTAEANFVAVSAFRPQRTIETDGLAQMNYLVTAEGSFPNVMRLIGAFESEGSLLAVRTVQLASVDGASDTVRVTLGVVAYQGAQEGNGS
jgi:hypothetical protein